MEEKPDVTYNDVGGCKEQIEKLKEVVETPLLHVRACCLIEQRWLTLYNSPSLSFSFLSSDFPQPEKFVKLGIEPPKGVLLFGPPGTGKTLCARAVANRTDACFIRVIGSELVQKYVGEVSYSEHTQGLAVLYSVILVATCIIKWGFKNRELPYHASVPM